MQILVTGSNGFIGKYVSEHLRKENTVVGVGTKDNSIADLDRYIRWDMGYDDIPEELLKNDFDAIVHIASYISVDDFDYELSYANVIGTHKLMAVCKETGCRTLILFSSLPIIGIPRNDIISEKDAIDPPTMYHATKAMQEFMVKQLEKIGVRVISIRIPSPIAPKMKKQTIFSIFCNRAINGEDITINGQGTRRQNYIDVRDIAIATEKLISCENAHGVYNIGSEISVSNIELAEKCIKIAGNKGSKIVFSGTLDSSDNQKWNVNLSRLKKDIAYKQLYSIDDTIRDYISQIDME